MENSSAPSRVGILRGIATGLLAAVAAIGGMMGVGLVTGHATLGEGVAEAIAGVTPLQVIEPLIMKLGEGAKHALFISTLVGMVIAGGAIGGHAARVRWSNRTLVIVVLALAGAVGVALLVAVGMGIFGAVNPAFAADLIVSLAITTAIFLAVLMATTGRLTPVPTDDDPLGESRRGFLRRIVFGLGGIAVAGTFVRWVTDAMPEPAAAQSVDGTAADESGSADLVQRLTDGVPGISPEITPTDKFYVVSKNVFRDPDVDARNWRLQVKGMVDRPMTLSYDDVKAMPSMTQYLTLQCISNEIGGDLMSNAKWRGISVADLLNQAGIRSGAYDVILRSADDYTDSIPVDKAMQPDTMLAYEMNDATLPKVHGFPLRLLVPDIYGMKNAKWITELEVVEYDFKGYWQNRGWSDTAQMHVTSRIDAPRNNAQFRSGANYIGGVAVAGQRGIQQVQVSTDGGQSWGNAAIKPGLGQDTWVLWLYEWDVPDGMHGDHQVMVRAVDGNGAVQDGTRRDTLPDGSTGYHTITIKL